ncbi:CHAP domain-containing protein [Streptomyces sp. TLI_185]|uniref:CHAP domain-containing protein n=1 Tax=Streptomyces sp. TLI_185 TaxID=2485151 RepID=UPI000F4EE992|nr:CHAP domain-containing protein [Streptomyces sp. TLI_185]
MHFAHISPPLRRWGIAVTALFTLAFYFAAPAPPAHADIVLGDVQTIADIARGQTHRFESLGEPGRVCDPGYLTSCRGNKGRGEYWCSDFARWVWDRAGFHTEYLDPRARSFKEQRGRYGGEHSAPQVGDAALFHDIAGGAQGVVHHVAVVVAVDGGSVTIVSGDVGGEENVSAPEGNEEAHYAHTAKVREDTLGSAPGTMFGNSEAIDGYVSPVPKSQPLNGGGGSGGGGASGGGGGGSDKLWMNTFATATGRDHGGKLYAGRNYVFCRAWGTQVGSGSAYNHWWLYTDMDTGGRDFVSAYYLSGQGNDVAEDENGNDLPTCDGTTTGTGRSGGHVWVRTFAAAKGLNDGGTLNAGRNYVFCKIWGDKVGSDSAYNHWWLSTDMDTGGKDFVSAYYLSGQGNDVAKDENGDDIPECASGDDAGGKVWVKTFTTASGRDHGGALYAGTNYVYCKVWGAQVGSGSAYNHWWLYTDMDTGGRDYVSAYYLSGQGNDVAKDVNGQDIHTC